MIVPDAVRLSADVKAKEAKHRCHDVEIAKLLIDAGALIVPDAVRLSADVKAIVVDIDNVSNEKSPFFNGEGGFRGMGLVFKIHVHNNKEAKHRCHDADIAKLLIDAGTMIVPVMHFSRAASCCRKSFAFFSNNSHVQRCMLRNVNL